MHELFLSSVWNRLNISAVQNMPEQAMGCEYTLLYMNMSNCARILNMPESAEIYSNVASMF